MRFVPRSSIGVLIADDSATICKLIVQLMQKERSMYIVGVASTLDETLHLAAEYTPDVLLLDLHLDDLVGHDPLRVKIGLLSCVRHVIAMSTRSDEQELQLAQSYGASRLVDKFFLSEQVVPSIRTCRFGKRPLMPPRAPQKLSQSRFAS
jgi:DNA-binding NarL/FixJ family response regulator